MERTLGVRKRLVLDSLPEFLQFIVVGKTILVANKQLGLLLANSLRNAVKFVCSG